jgi:hypothetical protein
MLDTQAQYEGRIRELASDLAYQVQCGELTELEANEALVRAQERWVDAPWG